ncbi:2-amino-4-hydroxy-6-hydroxymethyldihydropteridine diphosphokinase [Chitinimonas sp. BJYL2]|uniref:2-amino-4-hydroxy-6- hydroxymethyldihydropteridine diphosphokinase n=1 Tax=Chitinimonas sp. BJYL2 TaxID=2976696 RepID=UPI0027E4B24F|nr:2-amino-4-hydroxy-6-hydroxymethyldihydropteridine diphosphokinase [Chitinimonas sp. BJYL2]
MRAFIGLGANLGEASDTVRAAVAMLGQLPQTALVAASALYRSSPVGYLDQPDFINAVAAIDTTLSPHAVLDALLEIEQHAGRVRTFRNAPRTLDMDLLCYGDQTMHDARLTLPHPRMLERSFVLVPLAEIAPMLVLADGRSAQAHADACNRDGLAKLAA